MRLWTKRAHSPMGQRRLEIASRSRQRSLVGRERGPIGHAYPCETVPPLGGLLPGQIAQSIVFRLGVGALVVVEGWNGWCQRWHSRCRSVWKIAAPTPRAQVGHFVRHGCGRRGGRVAIRIARAAPRKMAVPSGDGESRDPSPIRFRGAHFARSTVFYCGGYEIAHRSWFCLSRSNAGAALHTFRAS